MFEFESPQYFLVLLPLLPFLIYCSVKSYADLSRARHRGALVLRTLSLILIVLALSKPVLIPDTGRNTPSAGERSRVRKFLVPGLPLQRN